MKSFYFAVVIFLFLQSHVHSISKNLNLNSALNKVIEEGKKNMENTIKARYLKKYIDPITKLQDEMKRYVVKIKYENFEMIAKLENHQFLPNALQIQEMKKAHIRVKDDEEDDEEEAEEAKLLEQEKKQKV